ncbi:MAG: YaaC family protein [Acidobacteriia bacterium]|nr:YaaC family protein [Terriglobia bacterium]
MSHDPSREVWKYLRLFLSVERTIERLRSIHNVPKGKHEANLKKQARQIGYCVRQAEQYFLASEQVDLATRPLLLYYGSVALSAALVLMKRDGTFSLDAARRSGKHNHHGLDLDKGLAETAVRAKTVQDFFSAIQCRCYKSSGGTPAGHFPLVYECLQPSACIVHAEIHDHGRPTYVERDFPFPCADLQPLQKIADQPFSCWELLRSLPDLYGSLTELGFRPTVHPGEASRHIVNHYASVPISATNDSAPTANRPLEKVVEIHSFRINRLLDSEKKNLLSLCDKNPGIRLVDQFPSNLYLELRVEAKAGEQQTLGYYPDIVEDLYGRKYFIAQPETYLAEPASMLVIAYCLGMLSRYFPDVWMATIDSRVEVVELTNAVMNILQRKFPNLILDQMTAVKHYIHT